jgi:hypothetical protein
MKCFIMPHKLSLCLMGVCVVQTSRFEESLEVVCRQPRMALGAMFSSHDVLCVGVVHFLIVIIVAADCNCNPSRETLSPLFAALGALLGNLVGDARWRRVADTGDRLPIARDNDEPTTSSPGACWVATSSSSLVV